MLDLVGNPNCWIAHAKAHLSRRVFTPCLRSSYVIVPMCRSKGIFLINIMAFQGGCFVTIGENITQFIKCQMLNVLTRKLFPFSNVLRLSKDCIFAICKMLSFVGFTTLIP